MSVLPLQDGEQERGTENRIIDSSGVASEAWISPDADKVKFITGGEIMVSDLYESPNPGGESRGVEGKGLPFAGHAARYRRKNDDVWPSSRFAPNEESAISKALRLAPKTTNEPIFVPREGEVFNSCEEAREFFNLYSWEIGFGIRYGRSNKNNHSYTTRQDIVCSCEGTSRVQNSASVRTGCPVMIRLLRTSDHAWFISRAILDHNHKLSGSYEEKKQWNSHSQIDSSTKHFIKKLRDNNVSIGRVCSILEVTNMSGAKPVRRETIRSACARISKDNMADDMAKTLNLLADMKSKDPDMAVRFKLNSEGTLNGMLWCTGKNIADYKNFGDAVTFDTTYRTNLYSLPFGLFVGVNNHFQSIIFGGVLLSTETTADFEWAFKSFVDIMGTSAPQTILTDQCAAMGKAIRTTLPNTRHRWCRWHVLKSSKKRLGKVHSKHKKFKGDFYNLITNELSVEKFEESWMKLTKKYGLVKNKYMRRLYRHRSKWAKPYFMGVFCAGMTSTQRSESANHMIKRFIQKAAPMHLFVSKFNEFLSDRIEQEGKEQHVTKMVTRKLRVGVPIEAHADLVYTRAMYEKFYDELFESGKYRVRRDGDTGCFIVSASSQEDCLPQRSYVVTMIGKDLVTCECGFFDHIGIICRHALKVLLHLDIEEIPKENILRRWTKEAVVHKTRPLTENTELRADQARKRALLLKTLEVVHGQSEVSDKVFMEAMKVLEQNCTQVCSADAESQVVGEKYSDELVGRPLSWPERTLKGGRPPSTGLNAWLSKTNKTKHSLEVARDAQTNDWPDEERPRSKKTKRVKDL